MTLLQIRRAIEDIPFVNPAIGTPEGEGDGGPGDEWDLPEDTPESAIQSVHHYGGLLPPSSPPSPTDTP